MTLLGQHPEAALCCTISDYREAATGLNWHWGVGIAKTPCYLSPKELVAVEKRGRLFIPSNSVIMKRTALMEVGQFIPELKFCCDWYAMYVAAFRHGICYVPEPLAIFHVQPNSYYHRIRRDKREYPTTLEELVALCETARLFIGGDTGPTHFAAAAGTPIVAIFGPTSSDRNGPFRREDIVVERRLACRPCYERDKCPLEHWQCILEITVDHVYEACRKRLLLSDERPSLQPSGS